VKENMGAFTPTKEEGRGAVSRPGRSFSPLRSAPTITRVASAAKSQPTVLLTKGVERDARRLHSMMDTSPPFARNWMLKGPEILSASATFAAYAFTRAM